MVLSFSDEEENIYQRMMQIISNSKNFEWCNMLQETKNIHIGELIVDLSKRSVITGNTEVTLTNREFEILYLLASSPGRVFSKEQIYDLVWEESYSGDYNIVMSHIRNIREKIEDNPSKPIYIQTVWGVGYRFNQKRVTINLNDEVERAVNTEKIILLVLSKIESCKIPR